MSFYIFSFFIFLEPSIFVFLYEDWHKFRFFVLKIFWQYTVNMVFKKDMLLDV